MNPLQILGWKQTSWRPKSRWDPTANLAKIFSEKPSGQNLSVILPRIWPRFSPGIKNPGGQNLDRMRMQFLSGNFYK